jgi:hypothetical protein
MHAIFLVAVLNDIYQSLIHGKVDLLTYITQQSQFIKYTRDNEVVLFRTNAVENVVILAEH